MSENIGPLIKALVKQAIPIEHRKSMIIDFLAAADKETTQELFEAMAGEAMSAETKAMRQELEEMIDSLKRAPMKPATFIGLSCLEGSAQPHALVSMDKGELGYMVVHDQDVVSKLKLGDRVALDGKATLLIAKTGAEFHQYGSEARFERKLDELRVEVMQREEKLAMLARSSLIAKIDAKTVKAGDILVVDEVAKIALDALPPVDSVGFYRFLDRGPIPDVLVDRDIGSPPRVIEQVAAHVREEMTRPQLRRKFRLRPCITRLLSGVSGSGKTLAVQAIHRRIYDIMSEVTGTPSAKLPNRVFRFKTSQILSMWLGESDKNADRLFDEIEKLAQETFTNEKGKEFRLPVMVVMEEAEGMGRTRGDSHDSVYDRILSTLLQRLDPNRAGLADQLVVFLSTTNEPHLVDPAFLRRIGGSVEHFGRLSRSAFIEVLNKHVTGLPAANGNGKTQKKLWQEIVAQLEDWLYPNESEPGLVELILASPDANLIKYRRDFITGALVDRSVQESSAAAWEDSLKDPDAGVTIEHLKNAITHQISSVVHQLTPSNVVHYLDLPEGSRVAKIRNLLRK